jgi:predicted RNA polymerase sigma factor
MEMACGRTDVARDRFGEALALARNPTERRLLEKRLASCGDTGPSDGS